MCNDGGRIAIWSWLWDWMGVKKLKLNPGETEVLAVKKTLDCQVALEKQNVCNLGILLNPVLHLVAQIINGGSLLLPTLGKCISSIHSWANKNSAMVTSGLL